MVIVLHVTGPWLHKLLGVNQNVWVSIAGIHSLTRFCVPIFIMITGSLLLNREYNYLSFFSSKFSRIVKPFLFWSIFYICIYFLFDLYLGKSITLASFGKSIFDSIIYGAAYHLWYLYLLLSLYVIVPFLSNLISRTNKSNTYIFLILWFILLTFSQFQETNTLLNYARTAFGYLGYLVLGHLLVTLQLKKNVAIPFSLFLIVLGWGSTFYPVFRNYTTNAIVVDQWYYYLNVNTVILSIGVFLFFKYFDFKFTLLSNISKHSFGIYFIHLFFIMLFNKIFSSGNLPLVLYLMLFSFGVLLASYYSVVLLLKFKIINKYIE